VFGGQKVVLFAVPGAFTPTCHAKHLPGFIQNADAIKAKGVDRIACLAVNDVFVLGAWAKQLGADGIQFLSDGRGSSPGPSAWRPIRRSAPTGRARSATR
jgi:glutaredoxin/glutathione-dependent peroxiredoxin